jgi:homoserine O-acetyltransferase/O-succinyltransferase
MAPDGTRNPGGDVLPGASFADQLPAARPPTGSGRLEHADLGDVILEAGVTLPVTMAYRHDGPGPDAPQVLVIHALTGSADAAGDWWAPLIGPGRAFDTDRVGVLCANLLGGRYGSTGPTSVDPATGAPWGDAFPRLTARDEARALWALADRLGIERLAVVTGGSLGGMIALEVALERPAHVGHVMPIAAPAAIGALAIAWNHIQLEVIDRLGDDGLALARQLAMTTYRSESDFETRFGRSLQADGRYAVSSYLDHQGEKLLERFDPATYRVLVGIMDSHDIGRGRGGTVAALGALARADTGFTGLGIEGALVYGPAQVRSLVDAAAAAGVDATYRELASVKGHDAFLTEWEQLTDIVDDVLSDGVARVSRRALHAVAGRSAGAA